jgi:hypothetical protein
MGTGSLGGVNMPGDAVFLSASVPDPKRGAQYAKTADTVAITAAVAALVHVTLGRRRLVWGGHPAITPMIWVVAENMNVDYGSWVRLYQSRYFEDDFPDENARFRNVTYTDDVDHNQETSLRAMRERMFKDHEFGAAVFIGGMRGIIDEFELFQKFQPEARIVPVLSTGGAVLELSERLPSVDDDLTNDLDYVALFHRHLDISVKENRYPRPDDQPDEIARRLWRARRIVKRRPSKRSRPTRGN